MLTAGIACSDPAPPEAAVTEIVLSFADTAIQFRDVLIVKASPQGALGVPVLEPVSWTSVTPSVLSVQSLGAHGDSARVRASSVGIGEVRVSAGTVTRS